MAGNISEDFEPPSKKFLATPLDPKNYIWESSLSFPMHVQCKNSQFESAETITDEIFVDFFNFYHKFLSPQLNQN